MLISVIITNYNYQQYLKQCLESVLAQTYSKVQIIVVDDGSTDKSRKILEDYGDGIEVIYKSNGGQASAFNAGFYHAKGDIIIFLDADDMLVPHTAEMIIKNWRPGVAKLHWRLVVIDATGRKTGEYEPKAKWELSDGNVAKMQIEKGTIGPPTSGNAFEKKALSKIMPIPNEFTISADSYLFARIPFQGEFVKIDKSLGFYRIHGKNNYKESKNNIVRLRGMLERRLIIDSLYQVDALSIGIFARAGLIYRNYGTLRARIISFCNLEPGHPILEDSLRRIIKDSAERVFSPGLTWRSRRIIELFILSGIMICGLLHRIFRRVSAISHTCKGCKFFNI